MIIAPTEPKALRDLGRTSSLLESRFGADVCWRTRGRWIGVQRKTVPDLVASVNDKRLGGQVSRMAGLDMAVLLIEGEPRWTIEGQMMNVMAGGAGGAGGRGLTKRQWRGVLWSVGLKGIVVGYTRNLPETVDWIKDLHAWTQKAGHSSLQGREPVYAPWGSAGSEDYQRHLLMGLPGVGVELADRIRARFDGVPWAWTVGIEELMEVEGIGKKKAETMMKAFRGA